MRRRRAIEKRLQTLNRLRSDADELATWRELLEEGGADPDFDKFIDRLEHDLEKLELELKLSGPDDDKSAIVAIHPGARGNESHAWAATPTRARRDGRSTVAIHPGAGGTESQDWAEMLLRMYLRWAEQNGYQVELMERQDGEEAGIKSATFAVRGENGYGYLKGEAGVHRLVRISPYAFQARRHTPLASA